VAQLGALAAFLSLTRANAAAMIVREECSGMELQQSNFVRRTLPVSCCR
jgi:hypothetical protein